METSGFEEETHFALWRALHHQSIFIDETKIPYASAYFNWLFYEFYATVVRYFDIGSSDHGFIRIGRWLTAAGALTGSFALYFLLCASGTRYRLQKAALSCFVFAGPLVGWWAHTLRPDVWALALETTGIAVLVLNFRTRPWFAIFSAALLFYGAWSFKQSFMLGPVFGIVYLGWYRRWRQAFIFASASAFLVLLTLLLLGNDYFVAQQNLAQTNVFLFAVGRTNLFNFLLKISPLFPLLLGSALAMIGQRPLQTLAGTERRCSDLLVAGLFGVVISLPLAFAASCKVGASSNYYFSSSVFLTLIAADQRISARIISLSLALIATLQLGLLGHVFGRVDLREQAEELNRRWSLLRELPEPRFCTDRRLNHPWLNPNSQPFVLAFNYGFHRQASASLEAGGIAGLVERGYFTSILAHGQLDAVLGKNLSRYEVTEMKDGATILLRKGESK